DTFKGIADLDTKALMGAKSFSERLKGIPNVFQDNGYNFAVAMASINYVEETTSLENLEETDDYYREQLEILVEWYSTLIAHLQQVWNVITTDKAKNIMTVAGFIMSIIGTIIAVNEAIPNDKEQTPEIHIHKYSDDVEIETKTEENQVDIYIQENDKQQNSTTDDKWLSGGDRT
ncbi:hypothetical protein, partial [Lysinibacillus xylanilyticus]|uniref:hypothetical protein n=1 Tax=Lysinibacillus xylanilyticus TaxID=582475 RepID=UPI0037FEBFD1